VRFRSFIAGRALTFVLAIVIVYSSFSGCQSRESGDNKVQVVSKAPLSENESPPEEDHPGTGPMAEISSFKERLKKNPKDLEALIFLGNSNFDIKRYQKAKDLYVQALMIEPKNASVRTDLATCFRNLGESDQAIVELKTVLALNPDHPAALFNLGVILLGDKGDRSGAVQVWQQLIKKHPESPFARGLAEKITLLKREESGTVQ
jgi:cytochrome c-type biogenesis protein CcmH/NrfG